MGKISAFYTMPHPPIIVPEVGRGEEKKIQSTIDGCNKIGEDIESLKPDTIIVVTPHGPVFSDAVALSCEESISGDLGKFRAPKVEFNLDINVPLTEKIITYAEEEGIWCAKISKESAGEYGVSYELDHGTMVPLYFINDKYKDYKIVHITYGLFTKMQLYRFGMMIKKAVEDSNTNAVFIASGDLSHRLTKDGPYEYSSYGEVFDKEIIQKLGKGDVSGIFNMDKAVVEGAGECGLRSFYVMLGAMNEYEIEGELLSYEGPFGVGYGVMKLNFQESGKNTVNELIEEKKKRFNNKINNSDPYVRLARESLTYYLINGKHMDVPHYVTNDMITEKRGVFVSLKKENALRGCIGTIFPAAKNIAKEIIRNAVEAGENDPRFLSVDMEELEDIDFSVDVLTEPENTSREELDPKKYGVIVRSGMKTGLLLPDLEGVNTIEEQLRISLQKGNISMDEDYTIERFEIIRYKE